MARPRKTGLEYFPHDTNATHDPKIMAMEVECGLEGYAFYFKLLEILYAENGLDFNKKTTRGACIKYIGVDAKRFDEILDVMFDCELFDAETYRESGILTSTSIKKRLNAVNSRRVTDEETPPKPNNNGAGCVVSASLSSREKQSKEKQSKEKEVSENARDNTDEFGIGPIAEADREFQEAVLACAQAGIEVYGVTNQRQLDRLIGQYGLPWVVAAAERTAAKPTAKRHIGMLEGIMRDWKKLGGIDSPSAKAQSPPKQEIKPMTPEQKQAFEEAMKRGELRSAKQS